jgi:hypothetical protein
MKKFSLKIVIMAVLTGIFTPAMAQLKLLRDEASGGRPVMTNPYSEVKGSAYLYDFAEGSIIFSEKDTAQNLLVAFNSYDNTLEHKMDEQLIAYYPGKISGFILNTGSYPRLFRSGYDIPQAGANTFVEILVDGNYSLIAHHYKTMGDDMSATYGSQRAKIFQNVEELYVVVNGEAKLFKPKQKFLQETFGEESSKVNKLIDDYSINLKEKSDVIRLITLLNPS